MREDFIGLRTEPPQKREKTFSPSYIYHEFFNVFNYDKCPIVIVNDGLFGLNVNQESRV